MPIQWITNSVRLLIGGVNPDIRKGKDVKLAKLGSKKRPIIAQVHSEEKAKYVAETCERNGWHYIIGFEPDKPEDISDLKKALQFPPNREVGKNRTQRSVPMRQRKKVQEMLRVKPQRT